MRSCVWVVDDSPAVAESIAAVLETESIHAIGLRSTALVLAHLDAGDVPRAMILDIRMVSNGNAVLKRILDDPQLLFPVIVLTGDVDSVQKDVSGRVFRVLSKTIDPVELVHWVRRALGR